ncbi:MAG: hypothetical protein JRN52_09025 [Nitrososphaerota archaeon]|nr:hypothetical protein [Nitrososphaerota archaeon]
MLGIALNAVESSTQKIAAKIARIPMRNTSLQKKLGNSLSRGIDRMEYALERKEQVPKALYSTYCPKCGMIVPSPDAPCLWCNYSIETELTSEEAREYTHSD